MAKQVGLTRYQGTMGGVRHFKIKGLEGDYAGLNGGPTKEQILNDPEFKRTRENMTEFGGSATVGKTVRVGLASLIKTMGDPRVTSRLTRVFKRINLEANGKRGQRPIELSKNQSLIKGFEFDKNLAFASVFTAPHTLSSIADRNESTLDVASFLPLDYINAPSGATHFRLINAVVSVSDYVLNVDTKKYVPSNDNQNGLSTVETSGHLRLDEPVAQILLTAQLAGAPVLGVDVSLLNTIGVEFYQEVGGQFYLFASGNAMNVAEVF
ncbi:MAG: hypothetical protein COC01_08680 [Bacteroidetes bacterium]|nr:MAG: hypothetical protein COC01_08680 [Bacteroidota bacterium]